MADTNQLKIIERGAEVWNDWRRKHRTEKIDLSRSDLRSIKGDGICLSDSNLEQTNLNGVNLFRADLSNARLSNASLTGAYLREAVLKKIDLYNSNLRGANLDSTDLTGANLRKTDLGSANLSSANLGAAKDAVVDLTFANLTAAIVKGANFKDVMVGYTNFGNVNLSGVKNLDQVRHKFASIIDPMTLTKSGPLPKSFLRGCGLSEKFIDQIPSLFFASVVDGFFSCFISYSHEDKDFAKQLHDNLQSHGIRCWLDEKDMIIGHDIHEEVQGGILGSDKVLLCCSENSLKSSWVDNEIIIALKKEQGLFKEYGRRKLVLIPLNLDNYMFNDVWQNGKKEQLQSRMAANFVGWDKDKKKFINEVERVINALKINP